VSAKQSGIIGAEHSHEEELTGDHGLINYIRDARGRPLWMSPGAYVPAQRGQDVRLSLDLEIQRITTEELRRGVNDADAAGGRAIVMDPRTGEILAMVDLVRPVPDAVPFPWADARPGDGKGHKRSDLLYEPEAAPAPHQRYITLKPDPGRAIHPALARNRCVEDVYEPGSTFKPFVWATITELGLAKPAEVFDTEGGHWRTSYGRLIHDVVKKPTMTWAEVLMNSSNIGMSKGGERLTFDQLCSTVHRFGFGTRTHIGLQGETAGIVTPRKLWSKYTQTSVCFGHEVAVTPVQMIRAFSVFARSGDLAGTLPVARLTAADAATPPMVHRVLRPEIAMMTRTIMREVAASMEGKMAANKEHPESGWRYGLFGKSGTAEIPLGKAPEGKRRPPGNKGYFDRQYNASFIGAGPIEEPRLVALVVIDDPGPERVRTGTYYGAHVAGPVVRRVMERSLSYLGVPPSPAPARETHPAAPMAD
jgi:cell division protein FtsI (penicillin-binding protein 3)